ncbi:copper homeostasis protein CutC [Atopobacter phocae]|uniref:copper homeostasis protein CutC n=1 Tax=Atopobacter phocae TaxID=136492 RepID=UPI000471781C|nr:copper homeostasis protein CutC [Atopobacter phocae]
MKRVLEVCAGSAEDCMVAERGGADRIELNSALSLGGLTPTIATLERAKSSTTIPIICMIRPRGGGFYYQTIEKEVMLHDAEKLLEAGADGLAFGALTETGELDQLFAQQMVDLIKKHQKESVFHRAFDVAKQPEKVVNQLIELGVHRILTSGRQSSAFEGRTYLNQLIQSTNGQIEILPGAGLTEDNIEVFLKDVPLATQVHSSCKGYWEDPTTIGENVSYAIDGTARIQIVSEHRVRSLKDLL